MIRVLVVDDSVVVRSAIARAIDPEPDIKLVAVAADGRLALERLDRTAPDVVVLDLEMPGMDGLSTLAEIRRRDPTLPVVIFTYIHFDDQAGAVDALSKGVTEFVLKPSAADGIGLAQGYLRNELVPVIRAIARPRTAEPPFPRLAGGATKVRAHTGEAGTAAGPRPPISAIVVAVSTGGPDALKIIIKEFADPLPVPMLIVQHMPTGFTRVLAERLNTLTSATVSEAENGQQVTAGRIFIAPGGHHLSVRRIGPLVVTELGEGPKENYCRPSADVLFRSAAKIYGSGALGLVLTGMGEDGMRGSQAIVAAGGTLIAQTMESATVASMPLAVADLAHRLVPLDQIASELVLFAAASRR